MRIVWRADRWEPTLITLLLKGYKRYDENTFRVSRQKSECEPLGGLWRLKCGKSGQERQSVTTDLLLLRKEIVNNVKYSLGESSFRLLYCTDN